MLNIHKGFPGGASGKELLPMQETYEKRVRSLGWEDPLEEKMEIHSSICLENPLDTEAWQGTVHGVQTVRQDWSDLAHNFNIQKLFPIFQLVSFH